MAYIPHMEDEVKEMLEAIRASSVEDLFSSIPEPLRLKRPLDLPPPAGEAEVMAEVKALAEENMPASRLKCFLGGGTYYHYVPPAVDALISRAEFLTAYTPYQPELSQGSLQAGFEFQTMVCELLGMEAANASMYDAAQAAAEAVLMAERLRPKNQTGPVLLARSLNPLYRRAIHTYLARSGRDLVEVEFQHGTGLLDLEDLEQKAKEPLAVVVQYPNYFGAIEELEPISRLCKNTDAVFITVTAEPLALALIEPPGSYGADIAVAEGQSLGIPMGFGGPHLGLFACREKDVRKMPGRLVGETVDREGRRGFVLTLATREQHIRRAKATSNICTNQALLALAAAVYMSLLGPGGLEKLARVNRARCEYLKQKLEEEAAGKICFSAAGFNEFALELDRDPGPVLAAMKEKGFLAGIPLGPDYPELEKALLITVTEMLAPEDLEEFAKTLAGLVKK